MENNICAEINCGDSEQLVKKIFKFIEGLHASLCKSVDLFQTKIIEESDMMLKYFHFHHDTLLLLVTSLTITKNKITANSRKILVINCRSLFCKAPIYQYVKMLVRQLISCETQTNTKVVKMRFSIGQSEAIITRTPLPSAANHIWY